MRESLI